jgi:pyrroloquinoline-quinone synthase
MNTRIQRICAAVAIDQNPYFRALRDGHFSRADFVATQAQFFFAVRFFNRPMSTLAARIPHDPQRLKIIRNVWEEHGEGSLALSHPQTFLDLLQRLGTNPVEVMKQQIWPEVDQFNLTLAGVCAMEATPAGAATLGIIEHLFVDISGWIAQAMIDNQWLSEADLTHYSLHKTLDERHSQDFFDIAEPDLVTHSDDIERGLRLGACAFDTLYRGLFDARGRR